uniref:Uncharacterized protein n=1 Tax=Vespula pensylvanica TaxID=30213 RepID=A0A834JAZ5_VESPE|nr:hypothetical protein H0235_018482 [Vespula pensylvanica]
MLARFFVSGLIWSYVRFISFLARLRIRLWLGHEAKKRLYAEEAPTNCGSRGQLLDYRGIFEGFMELFENGS